MTGKVICLIVILSALSGTVVAQVKPPCDQSFVLFDKTAGRSCLFFYRVDCLPEARHEFNVLFILPDRVHSFKSGSLLGNWVARLYENMTLEEYVTVKDSGDVFRLNDSVSFIAPPEDTSFQRRYNDMDRHDLKTWNWECTEGCHDYPVFRGPEPGLIYVSSQGLYKNYQIKEVRYFPASGYVIILTEQPLRDQTGRLMNGLLIYSLYDWM
jgi:hypothetical protein